MWNVGLPGSPMTKCLMACSNSDRGYSFPSTGVKSSPCAKSARLCSQVCGRALPEVPFSVSSRYSSSSEISKVSVVCGRPVDTNVPPRRRLRSPPRIASTLSEQLITASNSGSCFISWRHFERKSVTSSVMSAPMTLARSSRDGIMSVAATSEAPDSFAAPMVINPIGPHPRTAIRFPRTCVRSTPCTAAPNGSISADCRPVKELGSGKTQSS